ncbi:hypothetical protein H4R35_001032 [Dimargaris xerosporica]|nr:hypothetical protein H4R35_001032 [Dimargaris xerosporica]
MATFNLCTRLTAGLAKLYRSIEPPLSSPSPPALPRLPVSPTPTAYASEPRAPALQDDVSGDSDDDVEEIINLIPIGSDHSIPSPVSQARDSARDLFLDTPITTIVPPKAPLPKPKAPRATPTLVAHRYRIERPLGKGTFGSIFLATDTYYQPWYARHVTLKFIAAEHETMARTEYKRLRWINSQDPENTVPILRAHHAFYTDTGDYCLVMDCLMGGQVTLNPIAGPFPTTSRSAIQLNAHYHEQMRLMAVRKIAVQILSALALLNRLRLAHTDLKPENILRESSESLAVKLIDFGNVVAYEDFGLYYYDFEIQTLAYRAPEAHFLQ